MKNLYKIILVSVFIIFGANVQAQYQSIFGANHTVWKTSNCGALGAPCFVDSTYTTGIDTLINNLSYRQISSGSSPTPFYLAEDTATGRVWNYRWNVRDTIIDEIMDMTLTVNDSFLFGGVHFGWKYRVDSVYIENSRKVIRFDHQFPVTAVGVNVPMVKLKMIEGVGLNMGINFNGFNGLGVYLLCQEKDSVRVFQTNEHPTLDCNSNPTSLPEESLTNQITIQPNPASTYFELNMNGLVVDRVEIFDVKGSLIQSFNNIEDRIDVRKIENGIYFLKIHTNAGVVSRKLMIAR